MIIRRKTESLTWSSGSIWFRSSVPCCAQAFFFRGCPLSSFSAAWSLVDTIHDERLFLTLGLVGIHLRLGFLFQKSRKQIMRALGRLEAAARGEAAIFRTAIECMNCSCEISHTQLQFWGWQGYNQAEDQPDVNHFHGRGGGQPLYLAREDVGHDQALTGFSCSSSSIPISFINIIHYVEFWHYLFHLLHFSLHRY